MALALAGVNIRKQGGVVFRALMLDAAGALVVTGTATLMLTELQSDGTLLTYDFSDDTFKSGTVTTRTVTPVVQLANNGAQATGLWTYELATASGFTKSGIYFAHITNTTAVPDEQVREFQFGGMEGDADVDASLRVKCQQLINPPVASSIAPNPVTEGVISLFLSTDGNIALTVLDDNLGRVDLSGDTLRFVVYDGDNNSVAWQVESGSITVSGDGSHIATIPYTAANTTSDRAYRYALRDVASSAGKVRAWGELKILNVPTG